jgi:single-stranded DNA-binding protein
VNNINLCGRVESRPELLGMPGRDVCEFWLAARGSREDHTLRVRVVAVRQLALRIHRQLGKRDRIVVSGHLRSQRVGYSNRYEYSVLARFVEFVDGPDTESSP